MTLRELLEFLSLPRQGDLNIILAHCRNFGSHTSPIGLTFLC
jgi:hypothetical protein